MHRDDSKAEGSALAKAAFWVVLGAQWVCAPFLGLMLFFGLLAFSHFSPEEKRAFLLAAAYIPALVVAGFVGLRLLRRRWHAAAIALALAPLLLVLPTIVPIVAGILVGG